MTPVIENAPNLFPPPAPINPSDTITTFLVLFLGIAFGIILCSVEKEILFRALDRFIKFKLICRVGLHDKSKGYCEDCGWQSKWIWVRVGNKVSKIKISDYKKNVYKNGMHCYDEVWGKDPALI